MCLFVCMFVCVCMCVCAWVGRPCTQADAYSVFSIRPSSWLSVHVLGAGVHWHFGRDVIWISMSALGLSFARPSAVHGSLAVPRRHDTGCEQLLQKSRRQIISGSLVLRRRSRCNMGALQYTLL